MKRALELIKQLKRAMWVSYGHGFSKEESYVEDSRQYKELVRLLTPPTADEVCKALSEELGYVYFDGVHFCEHGGKFVNLNQLSFNHIVLIGKFYEGVVKE